MRRTALVVVMVVAFLLPAIEAVGYKGGFTSDRYILISESEGKIVYYGKLTDYPQGDLERCASLVRVYDWSFGNQPVWKDLTEEGAECKLFRSDGVFRCTVDKMYMDSGQMTFGPGSNFKFGINNDPICDQHYAMFQKKINTGIDKDSDGVPNWWDVCPVVADFDQADSDKNGKGDVCDCKNYTIQNGDSDLLRNCKQLLSDPDCDFIPNYQDNCPSKDNVTQIDANQDGVGDVCESFIPLFSKKVDYSPSIAVVLAEFEAGKSDDNVETASKDSVDHMVYGSGLKQEVPKDYKDYGDSKGPAGEMHGEFEAKSPEKPLEKHLDLSITKKSATDLEAKVVQPIDKDLMAIAVCKDLLEKDTDEDGLLNYQDNCPKVENNSAENQQLDWDKDGVGDLCDNCGDTFNPDQLNCNDAFDGDGPKTGDACDELCPIQSDGRRVCDPSSAHCKGN